MVLNIWVHQVWKLMPLKCQAIERIRVFNLTCLNDPNHSLVQWNYSTKNMPSLNSSGHTLKMAYNIYRHLYAYHAPALSSISDTT